MRKPVALMACALMLFAACGSCQGGSPEPDGGTPDAGPAAAAISCIWPTGAAVGAGPLTVSVYGANLLPGATVRWNGATRPTTVVDAGLAQVQLSPEDLASAGTGLLTIDNPVPEAASDGGVAFPVTQPAARQLTPVNGLYVNIERRGYASEYWGGQLIQGWNTFDSVVGSTQGAEAALQLDVMKSLGVNTLTYELRASDGQTGPFVPPTCPMPTPLGFAYPQPTSTELANFRLFLDLLASKQMKVFLRLPNTHMEEQPRTDNATWLGAILGVVKDYPNVVDAILFDGAPHIENGQCGLPAEPPLWEGKTSTAANYVKWAIAFGMDAGIPARELSAEEIVGSYVTQDSTTLSFPVEVMKEIFDALQVPGDQRTYAISMYEQSRCEVTGGSPCKDARDDLWADETLAKVWQTIGRCSGSRVIAPEMGALTPVDAGWPAQRAVENLGALFEKYGVEGGSYWLWTQTQTSDDTNPALAPAVKYRGTAFTWSPVQREIVAMGGSHLSAIPNGSFERGPGDGGVDAWAIAGADGGTGAQYQLTAEPGQPEVATRGSACLRLSSGGDPRGAAWAEGATLPVLPDAGYVLAANLRFAISGDPNPSAPPEARPQVWIGIRYLAPDGGAASRPEDLFRFFQEDSPGGFATFPVTFTPPPDAVRAQVELGVERNGLPQPLTADFDNLR